MRPSRRACLIGLTLLPLGCRRAIAGVRPGGPRGWQQARWGMDGAELDRLFGDALRRLEPPIEFGPLIADRMVRDARLAGRRFVAFLQHPPKDDRLSQVLMRFNGGTPTPADFAAVKQELQAELGPPEHSKADTDYSGSFPSAQAGLIWRFRFTTIALRYVDRNVESLSRARKDLTVRYTAA